VKRWQLINWFIREYGFKNYLEIGIDNPNNCHNKVTCPFKVGVDPNVGKTVPPHFFRLTSDAFFSQNDQVFDVIFIDGLHLADQVLRDVDNALTVLSYGGVIILHDCRPYSVAVAGESRVPGKSWYGTVWKAWARLRATRDDLEMHVIADDCGLGVIRRGRQQLYLGRYETFTDYVANQTELLSLMSPAYVPSLYGRK